jgi:hypothetical protein
LKIKIYKTIILPFLLYSFETWSLTFREERRLKEYLIKVSGGEYLGPKVMRMGSGERFTVRYFIVVLLTKVVRMTKSR